MIGRIGSCVRGHRIVVLRGIARVRRQLEVRFSDN